MSSCLLRHGGGGGGWGWGQFKSIYNITAARRELECIFNTSSEAQSRHKSKGQNLSSQKHHVSLLPNTGGVVSSGMFTAFASQTRISIYERCDRPTYLTWRLCSSHMLIQDLQILLWFQQLHSPTFPFLSSSIKLNEGTEQRVPLTLNTDHSNLVLDSIEYFTWVCVVLTSEKVTHGTKRGHLCWQTPEHMVLHTWKSWTVCF